MNAEPRSKPQPRTRIRMRPSPRWMLTRGRVQVDFFICVPDRPTLDPLSEADPDPGRADPRPTDTLCRAQRGETFESARADRPTRLRPRPRPT
eukprot:3529423-Prymnesium_polylepis.1